jgi:hypothetical protein
MTLDQFVSNLKTCLAKELISIYLYGSAAQGDYTKKSDYNLLVVTHHLDLKQLKSLSPLIMQWSAAGHPPPLFFKFEHLALSTDIFPIEFSEIQSYNKLLFGKDVVKNLHIDLEHMRLELEREFRSKVIQLREAYLLASSYNDDLFDALEASLSPFLILMRAGVRLHHEKKIPSKKIDILKLVNKYVKVDAKVFETVNALKNGKLVRGECDAEKLFGQYLKEIEKISDHIDACVIRIEAKKKAAIKKTTPKKSSKKKLSGKR